MALVVLGSAIANVALPVIARSLQATPAASVWVVTAYQAATLMALLPCAALGESLGLRRVFAIGVAVFTAGSALSAFSPSLPWLVAARFLQGLGGAAVLALGVALLRSVVPAHRLGAAIGWNALVVALATAAGPALGAAILSGASWPWLFAVNVPLGGLVLLTTRGLPPGVGTARPLDTSSMALHAGTVALLVLGAQQFPARPTLAVALLAAAALVLAALVQRERPKPAPLVPLDLLRSPSFRGSVTASVLCFAGVSAAMVALPFHVRQDAWMTALYITPWPLTAAIAAPLAGRLANHFSAATLCAAGAVCLAVALLALAICPAPGHPLLTALCGFGFGLFQVPNNRNMFLAAPLGRSADAGGMQGTARLAGQTAGAMLMTLLFTVTAADAAPRLGLAVASALALAAAAPLGLFCLRLVDRRLRLVGQAPHLLGGLVDKRLGLRRQVPRLLFGNTERGLRQRLDLLGQVLSGLGYVVGCVFDFFIHSTPSVAPLGLEVQKRAPEKWLLQRRSRPQ
jgi:DHA2 family multidrug resistance protein-like MFS transporter